MLLDLVDLQVGFAQRGDLFDLVRQELDLGAALVVDHELRLEIRISEPIGVVERPLGCPLERPFVGFAEELGQRRAHARAETIGKALPFLARLFVEMHVEHGQNQEQRGLGPWRGPPASRRAKSGSSRRSCREASTTSWLDGLMQSSMLDSSCSAT